MNNDYSIYKDTIDISITDYLKNKKDYSIKKILDILDIIEMPSEHRKKIRKIILDELNGLYDVNCKVLVYLQENGLDSKKT